MSTIFQITPQKMKFSIKDFTRKCDQIRKKSWISLCLDTFKRCVDLRQSLRFKALGLWIFDLSQWKRSVYLTVYLQLLLPGNKMINFTATSFSTFHIYYLMYLFYFNISNISNIGKLLLKMAHVKED